MPSASLSRPFRHKPALCAAILCAFCFGVAHADDSEPQITVSKPGTGSAHLSERTPQITLSPPDTRRPSQSPTGQTVDVYRHPLNTRQRYPQTGYGGAQPNNPSGYRDSGLPPYPSSTPDAALPPQPPSPSSNIGRRSATPENRPRQAAPSASRKPVATTASRPHQQRKPAPPARNTPAAASAPIPDVVSEKNTDFSANAPKSTQVPVEILQPSNEAIPSHKPGNRALPAHSASVKVEIPPTSVEKPSHVFTWIFGLILSFVLGAASLFGITTFLKRSTSKGQKKLSAKTQSLLDGNFEWKK